MPETSTKNVDLDALLKGVSEEAKAAIKAEFAKHEQELADLRKQLEELTKRASSENKPDDINKADLPEPVRKRLEDLEKRAKEAEEIAKAEREARMKSEIRKRAEGYANVGEVDKIAEAIYKAQSVSDDFSQELEALFKAAHERISKGDLFKEIGSNRSTEISDDPSAQFAELVEKAEREYKLPYAEAARKVAEEHPELVKAYEASAPVGKN